MLRRFSPKKDTYLSFCTQLILPVRVYPRGRKKTRFPWAAFLLAGTWRNPYTIYMEEKAFSALISGRVQGVGFRHSAQNQARRLRLRGWVRNNAYGEVEVWAEGSQENLSRFLTWLRQGPDYSQVEEVRKTDQVPQGYGGFDIRA